MIVEMLEGDETAPEDPATLRSHRLPGADNWVRVAYTYPPRLEKHGRTQSKSLFGKPELRRHDHMYDPISQRFLIALAFLEPQRSHGPDRG